MLDRCDSFNGAIIISCRCDKLLILGYISVQVVDSRVGQMIYPLWKVYLMKIIQDEPISIRNTGEIHENSKKSANLIGFLNRLAVSFNLTDRQPLDKNTCKQDHLYCPLVDHIPACIARGCTCPRGRTCPGGVPAQVLPSCEQNDWQIGV